MKKEASCKHQKRLFRNNNRDSDNHLLHEGLLFYANQANSPLLSPDNHEFSPWEVSKVHSQQSSLKDQPGKLPIYHFCNAGIHTISLAQKS